MYQLAVKTSLDKKFKKLRKKDKELLGLIERKVQEILSDPFRFKPLKKPLQNKRRVHICQVHIKNPLEPKIRSDYSLLGTLRTNVPHVYMLLDSASNGSWQVYSETTSPLLISHKTLL